jgi:PAS domain S-box-containing protein
VVAKLAGGARQAGERTLRLQRLNIGPRLTLCFILIILAMLLGNAVLLWQFYQARVQAERLTGVDQELIVVLQAHTNLMSFYERLETLADSENTPELVKEAGLLHQDLLESSGRISNALSRLPPEVQLDPTLVPTLEVLQDALPAELQAVTDLAKAKDWQAVRLRLTNQVRPLESRTSALVASIDREVAEKRAQALLEIDQAQRRILLIVPTTAVLTLLFASFLGLAITRSITQPLGRLIEGSEALAKGDFSHRVTAVGNDEIALVGNVFNDMVVRLQQLYRELQRREAYLAEAQKLSHTGSFGWDVSTGKIYWSEETFRIFDYDPATSPTIDLVIARIHPEDRSFIVQAIQRAEAERSGFDFEHRLIMSDGSVKYVHALAHASASDEPGGLLFVGAITDITESKLAGKALRQSESYLSEAQRLTHTASWVWRVDSRNPVHLSEEWYRIFGFDPKDGMPGWEARLQRVHPEDRARWRETIERAIREKSEYDMEFRIVLLDGSVKWVHSVAHPETNLSGELVQFVGSSLDITERKLAEQTLRRSEGYLADAQRMTRCGSWAWDVRTDAIFWSREFYRIYECDPEKVKPSWSYILERVHPEDRLGVEQRAKLESTQKDTVASEGDFRIVFPDGRVKHLHSIAHPVMDASGEITEVVGTTMDVTEQYEARIALEIAFEQIKELRDQLYKENIALREEVDKVSMFEEIVGSSEPLRQVLSQVAKVAATDSTVLVLGETGTGKEMIARAIHRRSKRANRAFIRVNCAAIPPTLIASELFGHEKGAFTGASQRRLGRFELADGGTLFLDEIGELPAETQSALLRVIQEREFERVGGTQTVSVDVRVLSATNRNLRAAVEAGAFRQDLFYRLNVFPIQVPSLRERADDIPLLVEYLIDRYAKKAGKKIRNIDKKTLSLFQEYSWPGNIRELQNVVERAVVLCDSETFSVDSTWLKRELPPEPSRLSPAQRGLGRLDETKEKELIETALAQTGGRVSGPSGAAALLGVPRQTLESKIANLGINKHRFKSV